MTKKRKSLKVNALRFAEYYDQQGEFDELYQKSKSADPWSNDQGRHKPPLWHEPSRISFRWKNRNRLACRRGKRLDPD